MDAVLRQVENSGLLYLDASQLDQGFGPSTSFGKEITAFSTPSGVPVMIFFPPSVSRVTAFGQVLLSLASINPMSILEGLFQKKESKKARNDFLCVGDAEKEESWTLSIVDDSLTVRKSLLDQAFESLSTVEEAKRERTRNFLGTLYSTLGWSMPKGLIATIFEAKQDVSLYWSQPGNWYFSNGHWNKRAFRTGHYVEGPNGEPLDIDEKFIDDTIYAFDRRVVPHVTVPLSHADKPEENTGYVRFLKKEPFTSADEGPAGGHYLTAVVQFLDMDIEQKVRDGRIADVSCGFYLDYRDKVSGTVYPNVLYHLALTNNPFVHGLGPWSEVQAITVHDHVHVFEEKGRTSVPPEATTTESQASMETMLAEEKRHREELEKKLAQLSRQSREARVDNRLSAYSSKIPPVVVDKAREFLLADVDEVQSLSFTEGDEQKTVSVTDVVFALLDSIPDSQVLTAGTGMKTQEQSKPPAQVEGEGRYTNEQALKRADELMVELGRPVMNGHS